VGSLRLRRGLRYVPGSYAGERVLVRLTPGWQAPLANANTATSGDNG
jgi:hypothetical protein